MRRFRSMSANTGLKYIDWPSGLREIYGQCFQDCYSLVAPDSLKNTMFAMISNNAFLGA